MTNARNKVLIAAMREASVLASQWFARRDSLNIEEKQRDQFVSEADRDVETAIRRAITAEFPDDLIIGEEFGGADKDAPFAWYIDPIDGTSNFLNGLPFWGVSIGLAGADGSLFGGISLPALNLHLVGGLQHPLTTSDGTPVQRLTAPVPTVAFGSNGNLTKAQEAEQIKAIRDLGYETVSYRCSSMSLAFAATGRLSGYFETNTYPWDIVAGWAINLAAGLEVEARLDGASGTQAIATGPTAGLLGRE